MEVEKGISKYVDIQLSYIRNIYAKDGGLERDQLVHTRTNALMSTNTHLRALIMKLQILMDTWRGCDDLSLDRPDP